jgi:hypothetical protein
MKEKNENEKVITDEEKKTMEKEKVDEKKMTDDLLKEQPNATPLQPVVAM